MQHITLIRPSLRFARRNALLILLVSMAALLAATIGGTGAGAVAPSFAAKQDFSVFMAESVATGDMNGDGKLDLVVTTLQDSHVSVLLNTAARGAATPSFAAKQDFSTPFSALGLALGDLNGDGKLDVAISCNNGTNSVSVFLNTTAPGSTTMSFAARQDFPTGVSPQFMTVGDLNMDGKPDLAIATAGTGTVEVLLNTTATGAAVPSFAARQDFTSGIGPASVAIGDMNNDGKPDLVTPNNGFAANSVSVLLNTTAPGAVTFSFAPKQDIAMGTAPSSVAVGDLNGDGMLDIATSNLGSQDASVRFNTTAPGATVMSFGTRQDFATGTGPFSIALRDLNGDGRADLVTPNKDASSVSVLVNTTVPGAATPTFSPKADLTVGSQPFTVAFGDFNGDGEPDIASANRNDGTVSVLLNTSAINPATPGFTANQDFATGTVPAFVAMGDLNGDGKRDLIVANSGHSVSVLLNSTNPGAGTPTFVAKQDFATARSAKAIAVGDLNGDGRLDLAVANFDFDSVSVFLNTTAPGNATVSFAARQDVATGNFETSVTMGDVNGDGILDLVVSNGASGTVSVLPNITTPGASTLTFAAKQDLTPGASPECVVITDLNLDGRPDLAVTNRTSDNLSVFLNTTAAGAVIPTFSAKQDFVTGTTPRSLRAGDLNGDGKPDLLVASDGSGVYIVSVLLNTTTPGTSTSSFAARQDFIVGTSPEFATLDDLNGDGKLDIAVANSGDNTVSALVNMTVPGSLSASFAARQNFNVGNTPGCVATGDLNGDGKSDLAVTNINANTVSVLLNIPSIVTTIGLSRQQGAPASNSQVATVTNYGGNGSPTVSVTSANPSNGVTISNIVNTNGNVTADIAASCAASNANFTLQANDGSSAVVTTLNVNVTANTPPTVSYSSPQTVAFNGSINVSPVTASDNGSITNYTVQNVSPALTTAPTVNASGVVSITNAQPAGSHVITIRATDNCGTTTDAAFTLNVSKGNQTITVGTHAPPNATYNTSFTVAATSSSGLPVSYSSAGVCTNVGATFTMTSGSGSCTVKYDQAGDGNFNAAPQVTESITAQKASQTITVGTHAPSNATYNTSFTVSATSTSSLPVSCSSAGACSNVGATFTMTSGTGTCTAKYDQPGDSNFNAASQVTETVTAQTASTSTALTSSLNPSLLAQNVTFRATVTSAAGTPTGTTQFKIDGVNFGSPVPLSTGGVAQLGTNSLSPGTHTVTADYNGDSNFNSSTGTLAGGQVVNNRPLITLSQSNYSVNESAGFVTITVNRGGDTSVPVTVDYATDDTGASNLCGTLNSGLASSRCDYALTLGTLNFAAAETQKTFIIPVTQDSYSEGPEMFTVNLSNAAGSNASLTAPSSATVTINDSVGPAPNAIDDAGTFVRMHYHDFLNREADQSGLGFWTNQITSCGSDASCTEVRRINVSAAFFLSIEFQQTGYLVERMYKTAYGDAIGTSTIGGSHQIFVPVVRANEFLTDTQRIGRGVVVLQPGWEQVLENNKQAYALEFVQTSRFVTALPTTMTPAQFVDKLNQNAGNVLSPSERTTAIGLFGISADTSSISARAQAVRKVAEDQDLFNAEFNRAFVLTEFFGYLRRNPNDLPDSDYTGYEFWLSKLNQFNGDYIGAEMVKAFIASSEYRQRFGP